MRFWILLALGLAASLAAGCDCGDDDDDSGGDGDADADGDGDSDSDADGDGDGDGDGDADGDADFNEGEPNDVQPHEITLPATITGQIGAPQNGPQGLEGDIDVFSFHAAAGTIIRYSLSGTDLLTPYVGLRSGEGTEPAIYRDMTEATPGMTRQAFLPTEGDYIIFLSDEANFGNGRPVGGAGYEYTLDVVEGHVDPEVVSLPLDVEYEGPPGENEVRILTMTTEDAALLIANVDAIDNHDPVSDFDSALVVMDEDLTGLLAENDDENPANAEYDSLLRVPVGAGATVNLVVDFYWLGAENSHHLNVQLADLGTEIEPDDDTGTAWPLSVTADGDPDAPVHGTVGEPGTDGNGNDVPDVDYFALGDMAEGDTVEVIVAPTAGSDLQPEVFVGAEVNFGFGPEFSVDWWSEPGSDGVARIEATAIADGPMYAIVADVRNFPPDDAAPDFVLDAVGGDTYGYDITAHAFSRSVAHLDALPLDEPSGLLSQTGEVDWYDWSLPADDNVLLVVASGSGWDPLLSLFDHTPYTPDGGAEIDPIVGFYTGYGAQVVVLPIVTAATDLALAVWNPDSWAGPSADYTLSIESRAPDSTTDEAGDFGNDADHAEVVAGAIAEFTGQMTQDDVAVDSDVFAVTLAEGQTVIAATFETDPDAVTDTILDLDGGDLADPIVNDDYRGYYSQVSYRVPAGGAGVYTITLHPYCSGGDCFVGPYGLRIIVVD